MTDDDDSPPPPPEPKVKELLSSKDAADLQRWFGLPSFEELGDAAPTAPPPEQDPDMLAAIEKRDRAMANVDPAFLDELAVRQQSLGDAPFQFVPTVEVRVRQDVAFIDLERATHGMSVMEPREIEISDELRDDMKDCTPQALLRDLHRSETDFWKQFEITDLMGEGTRVDGSTEVRRLMGERYDTGIEGLKMAAEARALFTASVEQHKFDWTDVLKTKLANRRVTE